MKEFKKTGRELQEYLMFRRRGSKIPNKKNDSKKIRRDKKFIRKGED